MDLKRTIFKGAFDSFEHEHLPRTKYDAIVDETSNKPGEQAFEVSNSLLRIENCLFTVVGSEIPACHLPRNSSRVDTWVKSSDWSSASS